MKIEERERRKENEEDITYRELKVSLGHIK